MSAFFGGSAPRSNCLSVIIFRDRRGELAVGEKNLGVSLAYLTYYIYAAFWRFRLIAYPVFCMEFDRISLSRMDLNCFPDLFFGTIARTAIVSR